MQAKKGQIRLDKGGIPGVGCPGGRGYSIISVFPAMLLLGEKILFSALFCGGEASIGPLGE